MYPIECEEGIFVFDIILQQYEGDPILFSCRKSNGALYLGQAIDENKYLLTPTSTSVLGKLSARTITIRDAFISSRDALYIDATCTPTQCRVAKMSEVSDEDLPLEGYFLYSNCFQPEEDLAPLVQKSQENQQDNMELRLVNKENTKIINMAVFSKLISSLNEVISYLVETCISPIHEKFDNYSDGIFLSPVTPGSFVINFVSPTQPNFENDTGYGRAFDKLVDMLDCRDQSMLAYSGTSYDVVDNVRNIMYTLEKNGYAYEIKYAGHKANTVNYWCDSKMIGMKHKSLLMKSENTEDYVEIVGLFYSANMKRRRFWFKRSDDQSEFSGTIDATIKEIFVLGDPKRPEASQHYKAKFLRTISTYSYGEKMENHRLVSFDKIEFKELLAHPF